MSLSVNFVALLQLFVEHCIEMFFRKCSHTLLGIITSKTFEVVRISWLRFVVTSVFKKVWLLLLVPTKTSFLCFGFPVSTFISSCFVSYIFVWFYRCLIQCNFAKKTNLNIIVLKCQRKFIKSSCSSFSKTVSLRNSLTDCSVKLCKFQQRLLP